MADAPEPTKPPEEQTSPAEATAGKGTDDPPQPEQASDQGASSASSRPSSENADEIDDAKPGALDDAAAAVYLTIHGDMYAEGSSFGESRARSGRPTAGTVDKEVLDNALRYFVQPPQYAQAQATLLGRGLVVLAGEEGSGRRAASLALLRSVKRGATWPDPVILPPSWTFARLADHAFQKNGRYLLADHIADGAAASLLRFNLDRVVSNLRSADAVLVITTTSVATSQGRFGDLAVRWEAVQGAQILDHFLESSGQPLSSESLDCLRDRVSGLDPQQAHRFIERLEEKGVDAALRSAASTAREKVSTWISANEAGPPARELIPVVTAAFVHGAERTQYERCAVLLRSAINDYTERSPSSETSNDAIVPTRVDIPHLLAVRHADDAQKSEPTVVMCSEEEHEAIFEELDARYGPELWDPVRYWLDGLPGILGLDAKNGLGFGVAVLARVDPNSMRRILHVWASGDADWRLTAAFALRWMCQDERTASIALQMAIGWCTNSGQRRAVTAALAFALGLGTVYPAEAISRLWHLSLRGLPVSSWARLSLAALVRLTAADDSGKRLRRAMSIVLRQLHHLLDTRPHDYRGIEKAMTAVSEVLSEEAPDSEGSLTLFVLRQQPELIPHVGELWAHVLTSFPHRGEAIEQLRSTFDRMHGVKDAAVVQRLGDAVRAHMDLDQWNRLRRELPEGQW